jgi:hypothetical protein
MRVWKWFRARPKWLQIALWILLTLPVLAAYAWPKGGKGKGIAIALAGAWIFVMSAVAFGNGGSSPNTAVPATAAPATTTATAPATATETPSASTADDVANQTASVLQSQPTYRRHGSVSVTCEGESAPFDCQADYSGTITTRIVPGNISVSSSFMASSAAQAVRHANHILPGNITSAIRHIRQKDAKAVAHRQKVLAAKRAAKRAAARRAAALAKIGTPVAREQAIESAQSYLDMGGFSRAGLIKQLSSQYGDGFSLVLATWAVDHSHANWNQQAVESAKRYLEMGGFSRDGLIEQLTSSYGDGFTYEQAVYAVNKVGL